jgi:hypothetical protein
MKHQGPLLESLTRRLAEIPEDFMTEPAIANSGGVRVAAVVHDLLAGWGLAISDEQLAIFNSSDVARDRNRLALTLIICWLLADDWFHQAKLSTESLLQVLGVESAQLAAGVAARKFVTVPERREELARVVLSCLGCRPAGETVAQAQDRLTSLSSTERARVLQASRAAEERARAIREALAKKAAQESADKYTRE